MSSRSWWTSSTDAVRRWGALVVVMALATIAGAAFLVVRGTGRNAAVGADGPKPNLSAPAQVPASLTGDLPAAATTDPPAPGIAPTQSTSAAPEPSRAETPEPAAPVPAAPAPAAPVAAVPTPPAAPAPPAALGGSLPLRYDGGASQVVTVVAASSDSTTAQVAAWQRESDGSWSAVVGPVSAHVGSQGIGQASEDAWRTPAGTYSLTPAFGRNANPGTGLPYFQSGPNDWWDGNSDSPTYNQHTQGDSPGGDSENLYYSGALYDYAINIDYNTAGIPGTGSAFFLHVSGGSDTEGCVGIDAGDLVQIMRWLTPAASPVIVLGVR
jgi:L,D-peptidoglycan transpeptidase YkuD (ErfK/YbiS/YcfS/YnhG family)